MRRINGLIGLSVAVLFACAGRVALAESIASDSVGYPPISLSNLAPAKAKEVRKGEYLTKLGDCVACHTDHGGGNKKGKPFSGGLPIKTPFGTIYSTNITPDKATGIGNWTFKQFDDAVRYGESPHGYLFAAMPYNYYNVMSKAQVHAIWEYLRQVPAVNRPNKPLDMIPPFSWRWIQFGWRFMFVKPTEGTFKYDPKHSAAWNRGRFIVQGPEHCGACHTPHNFLGGSEKRFYLGGSDISGAWAPDVSGLATGPHSIKTIMRVFKEGKGLSGGNLNGPMIDAIANSMRFMTPKDMRAVAIYLQSVHSEVPPGPRPVAMDEVDLAQGKNIYQHHCDVCHSSGVGGAPKVGDVKDWAPIGKTPLFILFENVVHGVSIMPPKGGCQKCSRGDITSAIVYMLKQSQKSATGKGKGGHQGGGSSKKQAVASDTVSLAVGEKVYHAHCSACHATGAAGAPRYGHAKAWASRLKLGLNKLHHNALNGINAMPPKGGCASCSEDQIISAVDYIVAGSGGKALVQKSLSHNKQQ